MTVLLIKNEKREVHKNIDRIITYGKDAYLYEGEDFYKVDKSLIVQIEQ